MTHSKPTTGAVIGVVCVLSAALTAFLGAEIVSYSRNTLLNQPEWVSGKLLLSHSVMGSDFGVRTRNLLARNRLNLHEWFGFNELILNRVFAFGSVRFSFRLEEGAYVTVLFNRTANTFHGVRLSRSDRRPNALFRADSDGRFLGKRSLEEISLGPGWHTAVLRARGGGMELEVDGRLSQRLPVEPLTRQVIGFRGGKYEAIVDDVRVTDAQGELVIDERFRNDVRIWPLRATLFAAALVLVGFVGGLARLRAADDREWLFRLLLGAYLMVLALVVYLGTDFFYWSSRYPYKGHTPWRPDYKLSELESLRRDIFRPFARFDTRDERGAVLTPRTLRTAYPELRRFLDTEEELLGTRVQVFRTGVHARPYVRLPIAVKKIRQYLQQWPLESAYTVLLLGTSQTEGTGASRPNETIGARLQAALSARTGRSVALINAAVRGSRSHELLGLFQTELGSLTPDLVVVNLSNNDVAEKFGDGLRGIVRESRDRGALVLFVLEPNTLEHNVSYLLERHEIMRSVATEAGVPLVDLFAHVAVQECEDAGFIWWDLVHLTSFGQALAAEAITAGILEHFGSELGAGPPTTRRSAGGGTPQLVDSSRSAEKK